MPRIPHITVTSLEDFVEKMKKTENHQSFYLEVVRAQKEARRLSIKDARRRVRKMAAAATAAAATPEDPTAVAE